MSPKATRPVAATSDAVRPAVSGPDGERFEADWLAARSRYDEQALDRGAIREIREWAAALPRRRATVVVDLGSGTGAALRRAARWVAPREVVGYAVDHDPALLQQAGAAGSGRPAAGTLRIVPVIGDLLEPLAPAGGPPDGSVDLVVGHALADIVPLDRFAARSAALLRPGGLAHVALVYDGVTAFEPCPDPALDAALLTAFHRHMDRAGAEIAGYGGSTAGRRVGAALVAAGLELVRDAESCWNVAATDGPDGRRVLARLIQYVVDAARSIGGVPSRDVARWEHHRRDALANGTLAVRVEHRDVLARRPVRSR